MSLKKKLKQKGALSEFNCDTCGNPICKCILDKIREQESALVVARQAIESLDHLNTKLTMEKDELIKELEEAKEKVQSKFWNDVRGKQRDIDNRVERFANRNKLVQ